MRPPKLFSYCREAKSKVAAGAKMDTGMLVNEDEPFSIEFEVKALSGETVNKFVPALCSFEFESEMTPQIYGGLTVHVALNCMATRTGPNQMRRIFALNTHKDSCELNP